MAVTRSTRTERARKIAQRLRDARSVAISTHIGGDGDGWGSACAFAHHLQVRDVDVRLLAASPMPRRFRFLLPEGSETFAPDEAGFRALHSADVQIVVDASEPARVGDFAPHYRPERTVIIDHHPVASSPIECDLSLVDPAAAATAELVYDVLVQTGDPIAPGTAQALYVGLVTDTGSFRYSNSSPHAHRLAAALIEAGADPETLYRPLFANLTPDELGVLQVVLRSLRQDQALGLTWATLDAEATREFGVLDEYEGVIDHLRNLKGTEVAVLFRELGTGAVKVSLRSTGRTDVASVARALGGGGHEKAAGAEVEGDLAGVANTVLEACRAAIGSARGARS